MPLGKDFQRGFVRGVGTSPSQSDRRNKRNKAGVLEKDNTEVSSAAVLAKIEQYAIQFPELCEEAKKFARRFDAPKQKTDEYTLRYIEDALKASDEAKRQETLLATYQLRCSAAAH